MNKHCKEFVGFIINEAPKHDKAAVIKAVCDKFNLIKDRSVYHNEHFAVRFCYSKNSSDSFSNTVLSLSSLEKYDKIPFFVVLVRRDSDNLILLANTTFFNKISHSSQTLTVNNIRGSFNGSDIMRKIEEMSNSPENFDFLFALHQGLSWEDNLLRLVEASSAIKPTGEKFSPSGKEVENIFNSVGRAVSFIDSDDFAVLEQDLNDRCNRCRNEILIASHIENVNIRGRLIESLITADDCNRKALIENLHDLEAALPTYDTKNGLGDYFRAFEKADSYTDIKTKVIYLQSNPKAYNIDKFLRQMADDRSVFLFFFVGIDKNDIFNTILCSVYHKKLIENTILQFHWAGRNSRGVAQFNGAAIDEMLNEDDFQNNINEKDAEAFLKTLLDR